MTGVPDQQCGIAYRTACGTHAANRSIELCMRPRSADQPTSFLLPLSERSRHGRRCCWPRPGRGPSAKCRLCRAWVGFPVTTGRREGMPACSGFDPEQSLPQLRHGCRGRNTTRPSIIGHGVCIAAPVPAGRLLILYYRIQHRQNWRKNISIANQLICIIAFSDSDDQILACGYGPKKSALVVVTVCARRRSVREA